MKTKKSESANLETRRGTYILIGLSVTLAFVFFAFEMKTSNTRYDKSYKGESIVPETMIDITKRDEKPKEPEKNKMIFKSTFTLVDWEVKDDTMEVVWDYTDIPEVDIVTKPPVDDVEPPIRTPQFEAEYIGGYDAMRKFLSENIKYPAIDVEVGNEGTVFVQFVVLKDGSINDVIVLRGVSKTLDDEAIRVVSMMPKWKAAKMGTRTVSSYYNMPIKFYLE